MVEIEPLEIMASVLKSALIGLADTRIQDPPNLSYANLQKYLKILQNGKLIKQDKKTGVYVTTEKGIKYLKEYDEIENFLASQKDVNQEVQQFHN